MGIKLRDYMDKDKMELTREEVRETLYEIFNVSKDDLRITKILEDNKLSRFQTTTSELGLYIDLKDALKVELLQVMNALQDKGYVLIKTPEKNVFNIVKLR